MKSIFTIVAIGVLFSTLLVFTPSYAVPAGEEWNAIKSALSDAEKSESSKDAIANLQKAKTLYENVFKNAALAVDTQSDVLIENAFSNSMELLEVGNTEQVSLNRQIIDKTIYKIAFMKMESAIENNDTDDFLYWFDVMEKKFSISKNDPGTDALILELGQNPSKLSENGPKITSKLLGIFKLKTIEEIEEAIAALEGNDLKSAKKFTYEGLYYYRTLHPSVIEKLGQETADELLHEMEEAITITTSGKPLSEIKEELQHISSEVELIIREYEGGDTSELGLALSGIKDRLNLVDVEYADAIKDGKIINQVEYDETKIFLSKAIEIFDNHKMGIEGLSKPDADALNKNFAEITSIVENKGNPNQISILVGKSLNNISSLQEFAGGELKIDTLQYIDEIERLLAQAKQEYRDGNSENAFDLVSEAYLDNYEFVEGPLGEVDPELMEKIEIDMREELRNMIQTNAPVTQVDSHIDMILDDLEEARIVIPEFGTIATMILVVAITSIIALSAKSRLSLTPRI